MKKSLIILILTMLVPFMALSKTVHTTTFPSTLININQNLTATGDGYIPIPYQQRFYYINHRVNTTATFYNTAFGCIDKNGGSACGGGWPRPLPDGDKNGPVLNSTTSTSNEEYSIIGDKLYYPVTRFPVNSGNTPQDWGLGCFDLATHQECGYQKLSTNNLNFRKYDVAIEGPFVIGTKFYLLDLEMKLYCLDLSSGIPATPCGVLDLSLATNGGLPIYTEDKQISNSSRMGHIGGRVVGNKLYLTILYMSGASFDIPSAANSKWAMCITESMTPCWNGAKVFSNREHAQINFSNYIYYNPPLPPPSNPPLTPTSLCNRGTGTQSCLSLATGQDTSNDHPIFNSTINPSGLGLGKEVTIKNKTYFPSFYGNAIHCFDWSSQNACPGWTSPIPSPVSNPLDYALSVDDAGCIWALGDKNKLWSLDPITRVSPCNVGEFSNSVDKSCPENNWVNFNVSGITPSDYVKLEVQFKDSSGQLVGGPFDLLNSGSSVSINLNTTAFNSVSPLEYEVTATFASNVTAYTTTPVITINDNYTGWVVACEIPPDLSCVDGTQPPCPVELPPPDFCCTPWTKSALESTFQAITNVGLNSNYTLQYNSNATIDNQINKYVALLQAFNPAIASMEVDFDLREHGNASTPSVGFGSPVPSATQTITWPPGIPPSFWNGFPLKVETWYGIHTKVRIVNNNGATVNVLNRDCEAPKLFYRIQVRITGRFNRAPSQAVLQISDGNSILKTVLVQINRGVRETFNNSVAPHRK